MLPQHVEHLALFVVAEHRLLAIGRRETAETLVVHIGIRGLLELAVLVEHRQHLSRFVHHVEARVDVVAHAVVMQARDDKLGDITELVNNFMRVIGVGFEIQLLVGVAILAAARKIFQESARCSDVRGGHADRMHEHGDDGVAGECAVKPFLRRYLSIGCSLVFAVGKENQVFVIVCIGIPFEL